MIESGQKGMVIKAVNANDGLNYSASVVATRKRINVPHEPPDGADHRAWAATFGKATAFDIVCEAAVWRGDLKPLTAPLLVIELAASTRHTSQEEFGAVVNDVLTNGNLSDSAIDGLETMLRKRQFRSWRHMLRTFPLRKKIHALCVQAIDADDEHEQLLREMGWGSAGNE